MALINGGGGGALAASYSALVLQDGPLGYWKLNDASGNFADSSGNGLTLTAAGTITYQTVGPFGAAGAIVCGANATGSRAQVTASTGPLTLEGWVYCAAFTAQNTILVNQSASHGYGLYIGTDQKAHVVCQGVADIAGTATLSATTWTHVAAVRLASGYWLSYINGALDAVMGTTVPIAPSGSTTAVANTQTVANTRLAECALYTTALSSARIYLHATATTP